MPTGFNTKAATLVLALGILLFVVLQAGKNRRANTTAILTQVTISKDNCDKINNCYIPNKSYKLYWASRKLNFIKSNWPNTINWDYMIKKDILKESLKLKRNYCIIDAGAHIGDGVIPLAHALLFYKRDDLLVVAIEPDAIKCQIIEQLCIINNLKNVLVINEGLFNKKTILYQRRLPFWNKLINNSGAISFTEKDDIPLYDKIINIVSRPNYNIKIVCNTIDNLVSEKIKRPIGIIHLDLEGCESKAIQGGLKSIKKYKPYLSIEDNLNSKKHINFLPNCYRLINRLKSNDIYKAI